MAKAYLALGANLGDRAKNIARALKTLGHLRGTRILATSRVRETAPLGGPRQGDFLNACAAIETQFGPWELLLAIWRIERALGRRRGVRWGPRTLDIDILFYNDVVRRSVRLKIPHPLLHRRLFVLRGLREIAPEVVHPVYGKTVSELFEEAKLASTNKDFKMVAVAGPIGVGKTLVAGQLARELGAKFFQEPIREVKGLGAFYRDPHTHALDVQMSFLQARSRQLKGLSEMVERDDWVVTDYFFEMENIFSRLNLSEEELEVYWQSYQRTKEGLPQPDVVVYLKARPETLLYRIRRRARSTERNIDLEYLRRVVQAFDDYFRKYRGAALLVRNTEEIRLSRFSKGLKELATEVKKILTR